MRKPRSLVAIVLSLAVLLLLFAGCSPQSTAKLRVVTSTALIAQIVERVGGDKIEVVNIIPPAQCPGHFDIRPGDIMKLADADLFLLHGWQGEKFSGELIATAQNANLTVVKIDVQDNWMAPPVQAKAVDEITRVLCRVDEKNALAYQKSAEELEAKISAKEAEVQGKIAKSNLTSTSVLCADQQAGFLKWTGLNVIAVYGEPDTLTPQVVRGLVDKGRGAKVTLVVDNLQSGADAGRGIAEELGARRVTLSNFPGGFDGTETWEKALDRNIGLLLGALAQ